MDASNLLKPMLARGELHTIGATTLGVPDGRLATLSQNFISGIGGNALGVTANGDGDPFPGTIWVATFRSGKMIKDQGRFVVARIDGCDAKDQITHTTSLLRASSTAGYHLSRCL